MRQVAAGNLIIGSEFERQRFPALLQNLRLFLRDRVTKGVPAHPPPRWRTHFWIVRERNHFPKLFRLVQTPVVVLITDYRVVGDRHSAALVDTGKRAALGFKIILLPM